MEISPRTFNLRGDDWGKEFERLNGFYKTRLKTLLRNPKVSVVIAMDVPFGWPRSFVKAISKHSTQKGKSYGWGSREGRNRFRFRETDTFVKHSVFDAVKDLSIQGPLPVSTDRLGVTAMAGAEIIHLLTSKWGFKVASPFRLESKSVKQTRTIIEVYPKATVTSQLGANAFRFGRPDYSAWKEHYKHLFLDPKSISFWTPDEWDAWVCALTAREYTLGNCSPARSRNKKWRKLIESEGWIWVPEA